MSTAKRSTKEEKADSCIEESRPFVFGIGSIAQSLTVNKGIVQLANLTYFQNDKPAITVCDKD